MGILSSIFERRAAEFHPSGSAPGWWFDLFGGGPTKSGVKISEWQALNLSTVWCCVSSISIDIAGLPFHVYRRLEGSAREKDTSHPAWSLIEVEPNPEMDALSFWDTLQWWTLLWGNGLAEIERRGNGKPYRLWPMEPWRTSVERVNGRIVYTYEGASGKSKDLPAEDVLHLKGMGSGLWGINVIRFARESLGAAMAADEFGARFFGNGAHAGVAIKHPLKLGDKALKNLRESFEAIHQGVDKSHKPMILEEGMDVVKTTFPPDEAQLLLTKQFNVPEMCRWFRFPPHKAMDLSRATFSNIEQQDLAYVGDTLYGWIRRQEKEVLRKLFMPAERTRYFAERLIDAKVRADIKTRYEAYAIAKTNGWVNGDEIRERENQNPIPGGAGKVYTVQVNMAPVDQLGKEPAAPSTAADPAADPDADPAATTKVKNDDGSKSKRAAELLAGAHRDLLAGVYQRILRVEADKVRRAAAKPNFAAWRDEFYAAHADELRAQLFPVAEAIVEVAGLAGGRVTAGSARALVESCAESHLEESRRAAGGPGLESTLREWESGRADDQATRHIAAAVQHFFATE